MAADREGPEKDFGFDPKSYWQAAGENGRLGHVEAQDGLRSVINARETS